jgi:hypothetical protein
MNIICKRCTSTCPIKVGLNGKGRPASTATTVPMTDIKRFEEMPKISGWPIVGTLMSYRFGTFCVDY